jgi:hypothetical protein
MASMGASTGYVVWAFFANAVLIMGHITLDNRSDPLVTYSPVTVQALVHAGIGFLRVVGSVIANVPALRGEQ